MTTPDEHPARLRFTLAQVEAFVAVARRMSFSRAASDLYLAQPWVSTQLRKLEAELGVPLFDRSRQRIELTGPGAALLPIAERLLEDAGELSAVASAQRRQESAKLTVGAPAYSYSWMAPTRMRLVSDFADRHPEVTVLVVNHRSVELMGLVEAGDVDLAFVIGPVPAALDAVVIDPLTRWLVVPPAHPLDRDGPVTPAELRGHRLATFGSDRNSMLFEQLYGPLREHGADLVRSPESNPEAMSVVAMAHGILSLTLGMDVMPARADARMRPLVEGLAPVDLSLVRRAGRATNRYADALWQAALRA